MSFSRAHRGMAVIALSCGIACAKQYVAVDYDLGLQQVNQQPEVFSTPKYKEVRSSVKSITIHVPDEQCLSQSASQQEGKIQRGDSARLIMQTKCGVWLSEMEKILGQAGYTVISWEALSTLEHRKQLPTHLAAQELKADVVLMVNSMEDNIKGPWEIGEKIEENFKYYESDPHGELLRPANLEKGTRGVIKRIVLDRFKSPDMKEAKMGISATLDLSAIQSGTGEMFWAYRRTLIDTKGFLKGARVLVRGREAYWRPVSPVGLGFTDVEQKEYRSSESYQAERGGAESADTKRRRETVRAVLKDFVDRFNGGDAG